MGDVLSFDLESEEWKTIHGPLRDMGPWDWEKIGLAELNGVLCVTLAKKHTVNLWLLTDGNKNEWVEAYTVSVDGVVDFLPLRVMRPAGKLLFYHRRDYRSAAGLHVYDPRSGECTFVKKVLTGIVARIGLCSSCLDPRLWPALG
jgi:hypothetical protein